MRRATKFAVGAAAVVAIAVAVISSSRAIGQRATEPVPSKEIGSGRLDVHSISGWTPPPCPPCWFRFTESVNFDDVRPPALPDGWLATNALGPPPLWVTSDSGMPAPPSDTSPNAAFIDDPAAVSDKRLDSFSFQYFEGVADLIFRQNFNLEASDVDPNLGYDGGVLELSTDGGNTFQDVLEAGGFFVMGGYNRTISTDRGSPIAGRHAWSGNSAGFITTVVGLPITGDNVVKMRWRMASDSTGSGEGWRVDTVTFTKCSGEGTPCPSPTPTPPRPPPTPRSRPTPLPRP